ncbi:sigma 54-interacting transcriptional regulator [Robertmurraya andreesenii]|uniref:Transcriptional regulator with PAS, ATPase and Fis domain n=1 Tax=Anoxybacillus andreesenii TaxID=1325932 RepID=A0ABT9V267_9BACL|nr:sigma 54-interacting transcriptional regulator [Robertmurraya andreesenii]MDQ0155011.1 transcriptional regulator with PAS, ATPase and Fis domain [Robertmurraya andreesenii]
MKQNMIMTSGYPEMTKKIQKVANELGFQVTVVEGILKEAAYEVKNLVEKGNYEVVISRAGTAQAIRELIDLPVVNSDSTHFDLVQAFIRAKKISNKICFITYPEDGFLFDFDEVFETIGFEVQILPYKTQDELVAQIENAKMLGMEVVVGGGIRAAEIVKAYGMKSMYITISERAIKRVLILASKVAEDRIKIKEKAEKLNSVIHTSEEGILLLNQDGQIETINPAAERIFGEIVESISQKGLKENLSTKLLNLLKKEDLYTGGSGSFTFQELIVTYEPVIVEKERVGTVITCREFSKIQKLENKIRRELHAKGLLARYKFDDIIHTSEKMKNIIQVAEEYSGTDSTVLIIGESGTGKELIAQGIHNASKRKAGPFVAVNCAALPEALIESELFGYAEGAFTGANKGGRQGYFELAHEGTIFLDEIGEIPTHIQTRLLRVLQEKEVMRVGGDRVTPVNIRIIAATNQKLWELVKEGKFRSDLYFRLSVLHLRVPPLRKRKEDIPILVDHLLQQINSKKSFSIFSKELQNFFLSYGWPGNIRQLENLVERLHLRVKNEKDEKEFIKECLNETEENVELLNEDNSIKLSYGTMEEIEKQVIEHMLERHENNRTLVAEMLGISRTTLWKKLNS